MEGDEQTASKCMKDVKQEFEKIEREEEGRRVGEGRRGRKRNGGEREFALCYRCPTPNRK